MASTVWKGQLSFGFLSLPVKFTSAARAESVSFNQLHKSDHSRVKQVIFCAEENKQIERSEIVKGYEYEKDKFVEITPEDLDKLTPDTSDNMEVLEFVKADELDPVYFEHAYHLAPEKGGERPYALLFKALRSSGMVAVTKIAMHQREHVAVLRPGVCGIILQTLFYHDEVRAVNEFRTDETLTRGKDVAMAVKLAQSMAAKWEPEKYRDAFRENIGQLVQSKVNGKSLENGQKKAKKSPVVDIQEALRMSIEKASKKSQEKARA